MKGWIRQKGHEGGSEEGAGREDEREKGSGGG